MDPFVRAGGLAGVVSRSATAPVDRAKMLMQVQDSKHMMTMRQAFRTMTAEGSLRHFFKGNGANCAKVGPEMALKMALNDEIKRMYMFYGGNVRESLHPGEVRGALRARVASAAGCPHVHDPRPVLPQRLIIGGISGAIGQMVIYPMEVVKVRLAVTPHGTYRGITDVLRRVFVDEGVRGLYRGLVPSLIGIFPYAGCDIMLFEASAADESPQPGPRPSAGLP